MMHTIPGLDKELASFAKNLGCSWIGAVLIEPKPLCTELNCHSNVLNYVNNYGGTRKIGYYFLKNLVTNKFEAILHSILEKNGKLIDITPFDDSREYNIIGILAKQDNFHGLLPHMLQ
jgi:hypothetical protein